MSAAAIRSICSSIIDDHLNADLIAAGIASIENDSRVTLCYPYPAAAEGRKAADAIRQACTQANLAKPEIDIRFKILRRVTQGGAKQVTEIRNIIAVSSAKGGVGKSTIAANLAIALSAQGAKTGLLDADIYGPSVPTLLGGEKPQANEANQIIPLQMHGIQALSMGHLVDPGQAMIWRGPMVTRALEQLLHETAWKDLDFLVLDMPPGTGDIQLTAAQKIAICGAVIITTPQQLSLADAIRGAQMFNKVSIPILGFIENMATYTCPDCNATHNLFGAGAGETLESKYGLKRLADLPLDPRMAASADSGRPLALADPDTDSLSRIFHTLASRLGAAVSQRDPDHSDKFPPIVTGDRK